MEDQHAAEGRDAPVASKSEGADVAMRSPAAEPRPAPDQQGGDELAVPHTGAMDTDRPAEVANGDVATTAGADAGDARTGHRDGGDAPPSEARAGSVSAEPEGGLAGQGGAGTASEGEKGKDKERDRDRDRDGKSSRSGKSPSRHRSSRSRERRDREKDKDRRSGRSRSRSRGRRRSSPRRASSRDRDRKERRRTRSRSRGHKRRSRSNSRSRSRGRRLSQTESISAPPPPDPAMELARSAEAARLATLAASIAQNPLLAMAATGMSNTRGFSSGPVFPAVPAMVPFGVPPIVTPQATRTSRRLYVGGLPMTATEMTLAAFVEQALVAVGGTVSPGNAIIHTTMDPGRRYAFLEFRSMEECANSLALDGVVFQGSALKIKRPKDYSEVTARMLGPVDPNPALNLAALATIGAQKAEAQPASTNQLFIGGVPTSLTEEQIYELLSAFGPIKTWHLVKDKTTGVSKGYAFCEYADEATTQLATEGLGAIQVLGRTLTVRAAHGSNSAANQASVLPHVLNPAGLVPGGYPPPPGMPGLPGAAGLPPPPPMVPGAAPGSDGGAGSAGGAAAAAGYGSEVSTVLKLSGMVTRDELLDGEEYQSFVEDVQEEVSKYGKLESCVIPRPGPTPADDPPGFGYVFLRYADVPTAARARLALHGRKFAGSVVQATFFELDKFLSGQLA